MNGTCEFQRLDGECGSLVDHDPSDPRTELFCPTHCEFGARVCAGCGAGSVRECQNCMTPLCNLCEHKGTGQHGRRDQVDPNAQSITPPKGQSALDALRADLINCIEDTLGYAQGADLDNNSAAVLIFTNLNLHITFQMLSGMAAHPPD